MGQESRVSLLGARVDVGFIHVVSHGSCACLVPVGLEGKKTWQSGKLLGFLKQKQLFLLILGFVPLLCSVKISTVALRVSFEARLNKLGLF